MRRQLRRVIPVLAVALLVQFLAPIGAVRFVAAAISDPALRAPMCAAMAADRDSVPTAPDHNSQNRSCCAICGAAVGGAPMPGGPSQDYALVRRPAHRLAWRLAEAACPAGFAGTEAKARAPPAASA